MRVTERINHVHGTVGDRLKRETVKVAGLTPSVELVRTLARDENVRSAAQEVLTRAELLRRQLRHGRRGRLARDPKLQAEVTALIRSAAGAVDATVAAGRRRGRRRVLRFVLLGSLLTAVGAWLSRQRRGPRLWTLRNDFGVHAGSTGSDGWMVAVEPPQAEPAENGAVVGATGTPNANMSDSRKRRNKPTSRDSRDG